MMTDPDTALIVIDVQNDFCPGGALAVAGGDAVIAPINRLMPRFPVRVLTQDWHAPFFTANASAIGLPPNIPSIFFTFSHAGLQQNTPVSFPCRIPRKNK